MERDTLPDPQQTPHRDRNQVALDRERIFPFLGIFGVLEDSKKIQAINAPSPGLGGQQKAAPSRSSSTGSSGRGSQEKGMVLLVSMLLPTLSLCPGNP